MEKAWIDYDREADVLYMSFRKPQRATQTIELEDDLLLRKDGGKVVGLTILNASVRAAEKLLIITDFGDGPERASHARPRHRPGCG
jgi:uncharacterized protein YuzE